MGTSNNGSFDHAARRAAATVCAWCGSPIRVRARGRLPKWCSASCRQRAWEQSRAAASGRSAVVVVERPVKVPTARPPRRDEWPAVLEQLVAQIDAGTVYERDLPGIETAMLDVVGALKRRRNYR